MITYSLTSSNTRHRPDQSRNEPNRHKPTDHGEGMKSHCRQCQSELSDHAKFCPGCGVALGPPPASATKECPQCAAPLSKSADFCGQCGAPIRPVNNAAQPVRVASSQSAQAPAHTKPSAFARQGPSHRHTGSKLAAILLLAALTYAGWQFIEHNDDIPAARTHPDLAVSDFQGVTTDPESEAAQAASDAAFEHYTRQTMTHTSASEREQALASYREAQARLQAMAAAAAVGNDLSNDSAISAASEPAASQDAAASLRESGMLPARVLSELRASASAGNASAQSTLALVYLTAAPAQADPAKAISLLESAARAGNADAMNALADEYSRGVWVAPDQRKADALRRKAAQAGSRLAQWELE